MISYISHLDGRGPVNPKGLQFYKNFIRELVTYGERERDLSSVEFGFSSY